MMETARLPTWAAEACPECGSTYPGTLESLPGVALGRFVEGHFEWTGTTEVDWNGSETVRAPDGVVLACTSCGSRWVHPSLDLE